MAGSFKVTVYADVKGPLADGAADRALDDWARNTEDALGKEGIDMLRAFPMNKTGRAHGGFENALKTVRSSGSLRIPGPMITGVVWSPWLEGTSKRNESTRFKGYGLFRKTAARLRKRAPDVGQRELDKIMPRLGGG
jgi:hypothetical protein